MIPHVHQFIVWFVLSSLTAHCSSENSCRSFTFFGSLSQVHFDAAKVTDAMVTPHRFDDCLKPVQKHANSLADDIDVATQGVVSTASYKDSSLPSLLRSLLLYIPFACVMDSQCQSKLNEYFPAGRNLCPMRRPLPFFSDLHNKLSISQHESLIHLLLFTTFVGLVLQGYTNIPAIDEEPQRKCLLL